MNHYNSLIISASTDIGRVRDTNEDNMYFGGETDLSPSENQHYFSGEIIQTASDHWSVFSVCDGMGGEDYGEVCSKIAIEKLRMYIPKITLTNEKSVRGVLNDYAKMACGEIHNEMIKRKCSMGSTVAVLCINATRAIAFNVGDSRICLIRSNVLKQLTVDHTVAEYKVQNGYYSAEHAKTSRDRHKLIKYLGADIRNSDFFQAEPIDVECGDIFLLCSDGLTEMCNDKEIVSVINAGKNGEYAKALVKRAVKNGGIDNVTVISVKAGC